MTTVTTAIDTSTPETLCRTLAAKYDGRCLLLFSGGKDSVAAAIWLKRFFHTVYPINFYLVPGLEFREATLRYYEQFFGFRCVRLPDPLLYQMLNDFTFQTPERIRIIEKAALPRFEVADAVQFVREDLKLPADLPCACGESWNDSIARRTYLKQRGPYNEKSGMFYPLFNATRAELLSLIRESGVRLAVDYRGRNRSFRSIGVRDLAWIKERFPRDYEKIREWFPLCDVELWRQRFREDYHARQVAV